MSFLLGIDTGGTYTDAVILDTKDQSIVARGKVLTTHENLTNGIAACIDNLNFKNLENIKGVSLSTTLATNAIVERHGCSVGLLLIGHEAIGEIPTQYYEILQGGHDVKGNPRAALNLVEVCKVIESFRNKVDAVAISGYFSIRNPEHELKVKDLVHEMIDVPVVCAHQLTTMLGFHERTVTAVLNAKLIPIIQRLIQSVETVLRDRNIYAPLMIVKGDGTLMSEAAAKEKPIDTILSGPVASIIGGTQLTGVQKALVLDMGGTTTDIAMVQEGIPRINPEGARVGGWFTRVEAAEIDTYGIGGDSYISINSQDQLNIGPQRVWPLARIAQQYPYLTEELQEQLKSNNVEKTSNNADCFIRLKNQYPENLSDMEKEVIDALNLGPHSLLYLARALNKKSRFINLHRLVDIGVLGKISVTPTDILHAKGVYTDYNVDAAEAGIKILARRMGKSYDGFMDLVIEKIVNSVCIAILQSLIQYEGNPMKIEENLEAQYFIDKILRQKPNEILGYEAKLRVPIVAIGAPVAAYLPKVAEKLRAELIIPENAEVANAIGAVIGNVMEKIKILIKPSTEGIMTLHAPWEKRCFEELEEAKAYGIDEGKKHAVDAAVNAGATDYRVIVEHKDIYVQPRVNAEERIYLETIIEITVTGRPKW